jgi:hypothetical protein
MVDEANERLAVEKVDVDWNATLLLIVPVISRLALY